MQKLNLQNYKIKSETKSASYEWQDYLLKVFEEFGISKQYQSRYWRKAKSNISFFRGCVENLREGKTKEQLKSMGQLLSWKLWTEPKLKNIKEQQYIKPKKLNIKSISIDYKGDGNYTELKEGEYEEIIFWNEVTNKFESNGFRIILKNAKDKTNN